MNEIQHAAFSYSFTPYTKDIYKQKENDEFESEIIDEELVLDLLKFSTIPLLFLDEDLHKNIEK